MFAQSPLNEVDDGIPILYRANTLLKSKMKNNSEITHYANQNKLVD